MNYKFLLLAGVLGLLTTLFACQGSDVKVAAISEAAPTHEQMVERGRYLVTLGGCNDCHSPKLITPQGPVLDSAHLLSGHPANMPLPPVDDRSLKPGNWISMGPDATAFVGPWGISFPANLTSDSATGIGSWSEGNFIQALRTGKHMGIPTARPILPPMPWEGIGKMNDDDLKAVFAYLKSTVPVSNRVPQPVAPEDVMKTMK
jgi:mono/diheme cytochrome c family protein